MGSKSSKIGSYSSWRATVEVVDERHKVPLLLSWSVSATFVALLIAAPRPCIVTSGSVSKIFDARSNKEGKLLLLET